MIRPRKINTCDCLIKIVFVKDLDESRLKVAKELGADTTFKITSRDGKEVAEQINKEFGNVDKTIECTGAESSIHTAIYVCLLRTLNKPDDKYSLINI